MSAAMQRMLRDIHAVKGLIACDSEGGERPVFPAGDRRKRPVMWVERAAFKWLLGQGALERTDKGYVLNAMTVRRLRHGREGALGQHETRVEREVFTEDKVVRTARVNLRVSALDRLARKRSQNGNERFLTKAEYEAGQALCRDWHRAGYGQVGTQNFASSGTDGGDRLGLEERRMVSRIDASTQLKAARQALGRDLEEAVIAVCCRNESLDVVERAEKWAVNSGVYLIKFGLGKLVRLYGTEPGIRPA